VRISLNAQANEAEDYNYRYL